jgi:hypothetical protein
MSQCIGGFMTLVITLLLATGLGASSSQNFETAKNIATVEAYTGKAYYNDQCETEEIYEADDLKVLQACDALEN